MKELAAFDSRFDAGFLTQLLDEHDIPWIIQADDGGGMFPTSANFESVKVYVSEMQFDEAMKLLDE